MTSDIRWNKHQGLECIMVTSADGFGVAGTCSFQSECQRKYSVSACCVWGGKPLQLPYIVSSCSTSPKEKTWTSAREIWWKTCLRLRRKHIYHYILPAFAIRTFLQYIIIPCMQSAHLSLSHSFSRLQLAFRYGDCTRTASLEEVVTAAKNANIHNFIETLPDVRIVANLSFCTVYLYDHNQARVCDVIKHGINWNCIF